VLKFKTL